MNAWDQQSGEVKSEFPVSVNVGVRVCLRVKSVMQLYANLSGVLCLLHAGIDLSFWDCMVAYNFNCGPQNVDMSCRRCSCVLKSSFY